MDPKQRHNKSATTGNVRKRVPPTRRRHKTAAKRYKERHVTGDLPSRPCIIHSDYEDEMPAKSMSIGEAAETLIFYSNREQHHVTSLGSSSSPDTSIQMNSGNSYNPVSRAGSSPVEEEVEFTPPLPNMSVTIADLANNTLLDPFNRKEVCQHNQRKLEAEFVDFWTPKQEAFSDRFLTEEANDRYFVLRKRTIIEEKIVSSMFPSNDAVVELIKNAGLSETIENLEPYCREIVLEFYANFTGLTKGESKVNFVFVRGRMYEFSPRMINLVLGLENHTFAPQSELSVDLSDTDLIFEITGSKIPKWGNFKATSLLPVLNCLHGICSLNWLPTSNSTDVSKDRAKILYKVWKQNTFNFGKVIFDQVAAIALNTVTGRHVRKKALPFPHIISKVLDFQKEIPRWPKEIPEPGPKDFRSDIRACKVKAGRKNVKYCHNCNHRADEVYAMVNNMRKLAEKLKGCDHSEPGSSFI